MNLEGIVSKKRAAPYAAGVNCGCDDAPRPRGQSCIPALNSKLKARPTFLDPLSLLRFPWFGLVAAPVGIPVIPRTQSGWCL